MTLPRGETAGFTLMKLDGALSKVPPPDFKVANPFFKKIQWLVHFPDVAIDVHFAPECLKLWWS